MNKKLAAIVLSAAVTAGTLALGGGQVSAASSTVWKQNINSIMARGWVIQNSKWYYYNNSGQKSTGWLLDNGKWYYLNTNGDMAANSWVCYNNKWYYLGSSGDMAVNTTTPDGYKVGADGAWIVDTSVDGPKNVKATAVSSSAINVQWDETSGADYYYVYYSLNSDSDYKPILDNSYSKEKFSWHSDYSATLSGIAPGTTVYFKVTSVTDNTESDFSSTVSAVTEDLKVSAPEDVDAEALSSESIKVTWDSVDDADYYKVYYKESGDDDFTIVKKTSTSFTLDDLDEDTKVYFKVSAVIDGTESECSSTVYATTDEEDEEVPQDVEADADSSDSIDVSWDEVDDADSYIVYYKASGDSDYDSEETDDNSITLDDLDSDTKYYIRVTAMVDDEESDYSDTVYATTDDDDSDVDVPENVEADADSSDTIEVSWDEVDDADYYIVYYKASGDSGYDSEETDDNSYTFDDLDSDTKYYFKVKAVVDDEESDYSDTAYATTDSD